MNHQKLNCYQRLIRLVKEMQTHMPSWPRGYSDLQDQIKRAIISAVLNLVEGNGRWTPKDRRRFFVMSAASICELSSAIELMGIFHPPFEPIAKNLQTELNSIYAMIWKMK